MAFGSTPADSNNIPIGCVYVPGIGFKALQGASKIFTDGSSNDSAPVRVEEVGGSKATYTYTIVATAPYATPTDWVVIRGSATKLVKVVRVEFAGVATAATAGKRFDLKMHTVANTGGTSTNPTPQQHDSTDAAATALVLLYSAAPTISGTATTFKSTWVTLGLVAPAAGTWAEDRYIWEYVGQPFEPPTLRGVAQEFAINFSTAALISGEVDTYSVSWTEE